MTIPHEKERKAIARLVIGLLRTIGDAYYPGLPLVDTIELDLVYIYVCLGHIENRPMTASKLARRLGMARTTILRRLDVLIEMGYIAKHGNIYCLGDAALNPKNVTKTVARMTEIITTTAEKLACQRCPDWP